MNLDWSWLWQRASLPSSSYSPLQWAASQLLRCPGHSSGRLSLPLQPLPRRLLSEPCVVTAVGQEAGLGDQVTRQPTHWLEPGTWQEKKVWVCVDWRQKVPFLPKNTSLKPKGDRQFRPELERGHLAKLWAFVFFLKTFFIFLNLRNCCCPTGGSLSKRCGKQKAGSPSR